MRCSLYLEFMTIWLLIGWYGCSGLHGEGLLLEQLKGAFTYFQVLRTVNVLVLHILNY